MSKSARNTLIAVAVVVVVAVAALPFVIKGLKKAPVDAPVDSSASESLQVPEYTYPEESFEDTTGDVIDDILATMDQQAQTNAAQNQQTQAPQQNQQTQATNGSANTTTTKRNPLIPTTTKKPGTASTTKATTTKKVTTTKKPGSSGNSGSGNDPITTVSGTDALAQGGVVSYLWNPEGNFYYVEDNPWQRNFGFNVIYDWAAAMVVMYIDTWRACFTYDDTEWMIQAWKGQYGFLFIGCELGVYTREPGSVQVTSSHYNCADDNHLINMEMSMYYDAHDGNGYKKMFTRSYYPHWWSTGFVDGHLADYKFNDRSCIIMIARMTMYDAEMTEAFTTALEGCGLRRVASRDQVSTASSDTFTVVGNDVYFSWKNIDQGTTTR